MNGDDGYVDGGGGGSVWWELHVSEATEVGPAQPIDESAGGHRPRKNGYHSFLIRNGLDKFTEHKPGDQVGGGSAALGTTDPLITKQGAGYFVVIIDDATQIQRIELDANNRMRMYLPINAVQPGQRGPRQASLRWGLRNAARVKGAGPMAWGRLRQALFGAGAVNTGDEPSAEEDVARISG
jgi:hypothetical protein